VWLRVIGVYVFILFTRIIKFVQIIKITSIESTPRTLNIIFIPLVFINIYLTFVFVHRFSTLKQRYYIKPATKVKRGTRIGTHSYMNIPIIFRCMHTMPWYQLFFKTLSKPFFRVFSYA